MRLVLLSAMKCERAGPLKTEVAGSNPVGATRKHEDGAAKRPGLSLSTDLVS